MISIKVNKLVSMKVESEKTVSNLPHSIENKEALKHAVSSTNGTVKRILEVTDAVINEKIHSVMGYAQLQVNLVREF